MATFSAFNELGSSDHSEIPDRMAEFISLGEDGVNIYGRLAIEKVTGGHWQVCFIPRNIDEATGYEERHPAK